jgi:cytochrome b
MWSATVIGGAIAALAAWDPSYRRVVEAVEELTEAHMETYRMGVLPSAALAMTALLVSLGCAQKLTPQQEHAYKAVETCAGLPVLREASRSS